MARLEACLVDAYQTMIYTDYAPYALELPELADVPPETFWAAFRQIAPLLAVGENTLAQAFGEVLVRCGLVPRPGLERELAARSRELLVKSGRRYDDVLPFLRAVRAAGIKVAVVSNCDVNTRAVLDALGVTPLADAVVLSCDVHAVKPSPAIYRAALSQLGVAPGAALFVDDNADFCAQARELGLSAVRIARDRVPVAVPELVTVRSLAEVGPLLGL